MPDVIDNYKVGELIKKLLKEHNMTQNDLAEKLNISRSAVSQNLNGKSGFDIQNLMKIAEIFDISVDHLLSQKQDKTDSILSDYERLVKKPLAEIKAIDSQKLNISAPDLYGRVFIEYVIENDKQALFEYLVEQQVKLFNNNQSHAKALYLKIIGYMLKKQMNGFLRFVYDYVKLYGAFEIEDKKIERDIFALLDEYSDKDVIESLFTIEVPQQVTVMKYLQVQKKYKILSVHSWIKKVCEYHLETLLMRLINTIDILPHIKLFIEEACKHNYDKGLEILVNELSEENIISIKHKGSLAQHIIVQITNLENDKLVSLYLEKGIYGNITELLKRLIHNNRICLYKEILESYNTQINKRDIGMVLAVSNQLELMKSFKAYLIQDDLDFVFSKTENYQTDMNILLLSIGAKVNAKYYNKDTSHKINNIVKELLKDRGAM